MQRCFVAVNMQQPAVAVHSLSRQVAAAGWLLHPCLVCTSFSSLGLQDSPVSWGLGSVVKCCLCNSGGVSFEALIGDVTRCVMEFCCFENAMCKRCTMLALSGQQAHVAL
jgi:hypothetical protein